MVCVFKCPHCGSKMRFSPETQLLLCDSCNSEIPVQEYDEDRIIYEGAVAFDENVRKLECPNCGSKVITETNSAMLKCGYCGDEMAAIGMSDDDIMPEKIIPIALSDKQALECVIGWWLKHETMPELDIHKMRLELNDIYVPVWLYDVDTVATVQANVNHETVSMGDNILSSKYKPKRDPEWGKSYKDYKRSSLMLELNSGEYRDAIKAISNISAGIRDYEIPDKYLDNAKTNSSIVFKMLESSFEKVPNIASGHFSADRFNGIEPYNYYGLKNFKTLYLSGHQAENYEFNHEEILPHITRRIKKYALDQCYTHVEGTVAGGSIDRIISEKVDTFPENVYYALVPVWVCSYYYGGKKHFIYVNGQTGKTDGEIIFNKKRFTIEVGLFALSALLTWSMASITSAVIIGSGFVIGVIYALYLILPFIEYCDGKINKKTENYTSKITIFTDRKIDVKSAILKRLSCAGILLIINVIMFVNNLFGIFEKSDNILISGFCALAITVISSVRFSLKRRKDMLYKDEVVYKDYIVEASTRVLSSVRS